MKQFTYSAIFLLSLAMTTGQAQSYRNAIGVSLGTFRLHTLDKQASPLRYTGRIQPLFGLTYRHASENSRFNLSLSGGAGTMNPERFGPRTYTTQFGDGKEFSYQISSLLYHANIQADYLRRVGPKGDAAKGNLWVGGSLQESMFFADEVANFPWVVNTATLSPVVQYDYQAQPRHGFTIRMDLAAIGLITRAIYASFPKSTDDSNVKAYFKQGTRPAAVNKLGNVNLQVGYSYQVGRHLNASATYKVRYLSYPSPAPIKAVTSSLSLESEVRF